MTSSHTVRKGLGSQAEKCTKTGNITPTPDRAALGLLRMCNQLVRQAGARLRGLLGPSVALAAALGAPAALASTELAQASRCMACHQVDRKVVGPAFREIGRRYAGRADAVPWLARKIREGGGGAWGAVPMAANPHVSEADAKRLAQWILTLK